MQLLLGFTILLYSWIALYLVGTSLAVQLEREQAATYQSHFPGGAS